MTRALLATTRSAPSRTRRRRGSAPGWTGFAIWCAARVRSLRFHPRALADMSGEAVTGCEMN